MKHKRKLSVYKLPMCPGYSAMAFHVHGFGTLTAIRSGVDLPAYIPKWNVQSSAVGIEIILTLLSRMISTCWNLMLGKSCLYQLPTSTVLAAATRSDKHKNGSYPTLHIKLRAGNLSALFLRNILEGYQVFVSRRRPTLEAKARVHWIGR
jgi:hypothetical protein